MTDFVIFHLSPCVFNNGFIGLIAVNFAEYGGQVGDDESIQDPPDTGTFSLRSFVITFTDAKEQAFLDPLQITRLLSSCNSMSAMIDLQRYYV